MLQLHIFFSWVELLQFFRIVEPSGDTGAHLISHWFRLALFFILSLINEVKNEPFRQGMMRKALELFQEEKLVCDWLWSINFSYRPNLSL
jgi:hypothetical protein